MSNGTAEAHPSSTHEQNEHMERIAHEEDMAWSYGSPPTPLEVHLEGDDFLVVIRNAYNEDTLFSKILLHPEHHPRFTIKNNLIYIKNTVGNVVIAVPEALSKGRRVTEIVIDQAHRIVGHTATRRIRDYLSRWFW